MKNKTWLPFLYVLPLPTQYCISVRPKSSAPISAISGLVRHRRLIFMDPTQIFHHSGRASDWRKWSEYVGNGSSIWCLDAGDFSLKQYTVQVWKLTVKRPS